MREGINTPRNKEVELSACSHRVIIPLHIPNEKGYYKDAFKIFEMCLISVSKTSISPLKISVISNGSCETVHAKLFPLLKEHQIDELIIETEAIGKINSILKVLRTAKERLITITDADVLFLNNWEKELLNVFNSFPKAGMVSPVPVFRTHLRLTSNIWMHYLFSKRLKFRPVKNPDAMTRFANSIGWPWLETKYKDKIATLTAKNSTVAVVGNSHFVGTYKREVFSRLPKEDSHYKLGGDSENLYTDLPVLKYGGYRLATYDNYAYHLGNVIEPWMINKFNSIGNETKLFNDFSTFKILSQNRMSYFLSEKIFKKMFKFKIVKKRIFKLKGLNDEQIKSYMG